MAETIDGLISALVGMGFELEDCQDAIKFGKMSVAAAVEWILAGKPMNQHAMPGSSPVLNLARKKKVVTTTSTASSAFNAPLPIDDAPSHSQHVQGSHEMDEEGKGPQHNEEVHSRYAATRNEREKFFEKKRLKFADDVKQYKAMEKKAKDLVLQEIEADRKARWLKTSHSKTDVESGKQTTDHVEGSTLGREEGSKKTSCLIQFRLPDGQALRSSFPNAATLQDLVAFLTEQHKTLVGKRIIFIQPFPRKEFDPYNQHESLEQLRLTPSSNLVVQFSTERLQTDPQVAQSNPVSSAVAASIERCDPPMLEELGRAVTITTPNDLSHAVGQPPPGQQYSFARPAVLEHQWPEGSGQRLLNEEDEDNNVPRNLEIEVSLDVQGEEMNEAERNQIPGELGAAHAGIDIRVPIASAVGNIPIHQQMHTWGSGHALSEPADLENPPENDRLPVNDGLPQEDEDPGVPDIFDPNLGFGARLGSSNQDVRNLQRMSPAVRRSEVAEIHQARLHQINQNEIESRGNDDIKPQATESNIARLVQLCMQAVVLRIGAVGRQSLVSFGNLPPQLAHRFFQHLVMCKKLNSNTLHLFRSSPISIVNLDYYIYTTNQLLKSLQPFPNIQHLSLRGASLITDTGLQAVSSLLKLKFLNLEGSCQISDEGIKHLHNLPHLTSLLLNGAHVTDVGMRRYLQSRSSPKNMTRLSLSNIANVTNATLENLSYVPNLRSLNLAHTGINRIDLIVQNGSKLEELSLAGCSIPVEQFVHLQALKDSLKSLNISDVNTGESQAGDQVLRSLNGMHQLRSIEMQFRASLTHEGISSICRCPLTQLDLSNYTLIDDQAMTYICAMRKLRYLNLSNTRITDDSLHLLAPVFTNLIEFFLHHTSITSDGLIRLFEACTATATDLTSFSLAFTNVGNKFIVGGHLNASCPSLVELNLSSTNVSDSGVRELNLPALSRLLLDGTRVNRLIDSFCFSHCPSLRHVRADNRKPRTMLDMDSDTES